MKKSLRYAVILLVLAGAGFGGYKWVGQRKATAQAAAATAEAPERQEVGPDERLAEAPAAEIAAEWLGLMAHPKHPVLT